MSTTEKQIASMLQRYVDAVRDKDAGALLALYAPDMRSFDLWGRWSHDAASWRTSVEQWFGSLGDETVAVRFDELRITGNEEFASASAIGSYAAIAADGSVLRSMQNRFTWVLARHDTGWRVLHEHSSAPIDATSLQVILQKTG
jgi:uncharacterized protein (TIGR02246 family)